MPTPCWLKHLCSIRALFPMSVYLSLSLYFWLIPWSVKASCVTQGILASFLFQSLIVDSGPPGSGPIKDQHPAILGGWHPSGGSQPEISAPEETHTHDMTHPLCTQESEWLGWGEVIRSTTQLGRVRSPTTWSPKQFIPGRAQNAYPTESLPLWGTREPEWCRSRKCMQPRALIRQVPSRATWSLSSVTGKAYTPWAEANSVWPGHFMYSPHMPVIFLWVFLPPHITTEPSCEPK